MSYLKNEQIWVHPLCTVGFVISFGHPLWALNIFLHNCTGLPRDGALLLSSCAVSPASGDCVFPDNGLLRFLWPGICRAGSAHQQTSDLWINATITCDRKVTMPLIICAPGFMSTHFLIQRWPSGQFWRLTATPMFDQFKQAKDYCLQKALATVCPWPCVTEHRASAAGCIQNEILKWCNIAFWQCIISELGCLYNLYILIIVILCCILSDYKLGKSFLAYWFNQSNF